MRVIIQRVSRADVSINNHLKAEISRGLLILLGIEDLDTQTDVEWLSGKISKLRIFNDAEGIMNRSVMDIDGDILVVSQFTLHASTRKGNRPSYIKSSKPDISIPLYTSFIKQLEVDTGKSVKTGEFGAMMKVELVNDGPVTLFIDSKNKE